MDTQSTCRRSASTPAKMLSMPVVAALLRVTTLISLSFALSRSHSLRSSLCRFALSRSHSLRSSLCRFALSRSHSLRSSHGLVVEVGQTQVLAGGDRVLVHPLADRQVEYPQAEGRENDRTAPIHGSASEHDVRKSACYEISV